MKWPGSTSDYMAWSTSKLCLILEKYNETNIVLDGKTIVGNDAYVKRMYMTVPLKGTQTEHFNTYNFYLS